MKLTASKAVPKSPKDPVPIPGFSITDVEFSRFQALVLDATGISLSEQKKALVIGRLGSRLRNRGVHTFSEYYKILRDPSESIELQTAIDLITTNETSFFREPEHFQVLKDYLQSLRPVPFPFRVWSAASSSGEEAYSIAMVLADRLASAEWYVQGTDISTRVVERARQGLYPMERSTTIPKDYLQRYCLKGQGKYEGMFRIDGRLRERVTFAHGNLGQLDPRLGLFQVAFLRNVLIYFDLEQKRKVVKGVMDHIVPGGLLIVGHSESITGLCPGITQVRPTVYRVS